MSKYIIEIEDEPFVRLSALFREEGLYRAKGFNSLVFDKFGLDKLTPLDKELEEAYQKGVHEGSLDVKQRVDGAYQKGYEVGQHEATTLEYQQGLKDMLEAIKKISNMSAEDKDAVFDTQTLYYIVNNYTANEIMKKLATYEQQKQKIKVGDEVRSKVTGSIGTVMKSNVGGDPDYIYLLYDDGSMGKYLKSEHRKTGRHFHYAEKLLNEMRGDED